MNELDLLISKRLKKYAGRHHPPVNSKMRLMHAARNMNIARPRHFDRRPTLLKRFSDGAIVNPWYYLPFDLQNPYSFQWSVSSRFL